jgi:hypothetical protein
VKEIGVLGTKPCPLFLGNLTAAIFSLPKAWDKTWDSVANESGNSCLNDDQNAVSSANFFFDRSYQGAPKVPCSTENARLQARSLSPAKSKHEASWGLTEIPEALRALVIGIVKHEGSHNPSRIITALCESDRYDLLAVVPSQVRSAARCTTMPLRCRTEAGIR